MFTNNKLKHFLMAILLVGGLSLTSCGGSDDEPDMPDGEEQVDDNNGGGGTNANPMAGKTIRCIDKYEGSSTRINTNFSITFNSATRFTQVLKQTAEELDWATNKWTVTLSLDKELTGTYTYSDSQIVLSATDGTVKTLKKSGNGWADGNYLYK